MSRKHRTEAEPDHGSSAVAPLKHPHMDAERIEWDADHGSSAVAPLKQAIARRAVEDAARADHGSSAVAPLKHTLPGVTEVRQFAV